jgi:glycosyltransferase involved in cell wall biosynthesis
MADVTAGGDAAAAASAPLVSIIMPAYNAAAFVGEAIRSVLAQTLRDFELIVVDDASTDGTAEAVRACADPRIVLLRIEINSGAVGARNAGIAAARGAYIALLDADDQADARRLEHQVALLRASGADLCAANYRRWDPRSGRIRRGHQYRRDADLKALLTVYCPIGNSTVTGKAEAFKSDPYDPAYAHAEDYELWARLAAQGRRFVALDAPLMTYRLHEGQSSIRNRERVEAAADAVRRAYLRALGIDAAWAPRRLPWRERLRVAPHFLRLLRQRFGPVSVRANREIYARFQFRGNGWLTPWVRLERWLVAAWARWG